LAVSARCAVPARRAMATYPDFPNFTVKKNNWVEVRKG
jgi:hypothetical protein